MKTQQLCWAAAALLACFGCGSDDDDADSEATEPTDTVVVMLSTDTATASSGEVDAGTIVNPGVATDTVVDITVTCGTDECLEPTWIPITGGSFEMGSANGDATETPVHTVAVADFEMLKTEVTLAQYAECVVAGECPVPDKGTAVEDVWEHPTRGNFPINGVTWSEAAAFCEWLGGRLPSEAEWEYAARNGGQGILYPWGDEEATCDYAIMIDADHNEGCGTIFVFDVCSRTAGNTASGLCDMAGNLWEWVQDTYQMSYDGAPTDGSAWEVDGTVERVMRGGSYREDATGVRSTQRNLLFQNASFDNLGFRCAR